MKTIKQAPRIEALSPDVDKISFLKKIQGEGIKCTRAKIFKKKNKYTTHVQEDVARACHAERQRGPGAWRRRTAEMVRKKGAENAA